MLPSTDRRTGGHGSFPSARCGWGDNCDASQLVGRSLQQRKLVVVVPGSQGYVRRFALQSAGEQAATLSTFERCTKMGHHTTTRHESTCGRDFMHVWTNGSKRSKFSRSTYICAPRHIKTRKLVCCVNASKTCTPSRLYILSCPTQPSRLNSFATHIQEQHVSSPRRGMSILSREVLYSSQSHTSHRVAQQQM